MSNSYTSVTNGSFEAPVTINFDEDTYFHYLSINIGNSDNFVANNTITFINFSSPNSIIITKTFYKVISFIETIDNVSNVVPGKYN